MNLDETVGPNTNITYGMRQTFEALRDGDYGNFALFSCFLNGEPTSAIVALNEEDGQITIQPLFVWVTPNMKLVDHDGLSPNSYQHLEEEQ